MRRQGQCSADIKRNGYWTGRPCSRMAVVERDGKGYCHQHDPVAAQRERERRNAETDRLRVEARRMEDYRIAREKYRDACEEVIKDIAVSDTFDAPAREKIKALYSRRPT